MGYLTIFLSVGWSESSGSAKFHCKVSFRISTKETGCGMYLIVRQPSNPNLVVTGERHKKLSELLMGYLHNFS